MSETLIEKDIFVPMRDGVKLATDIYRQKEAGPMPVLMARTPYNKESPAAFRGLFDIHRAVEAGFVVVIQDVRGRFASEGKFNPHFQEENDGIDAFAWAASQPWSNGTLGTFGGSYLGATQWLPARKNPPSLKVMAPSITFSDSYEGCMYQGGAKVLHDLRWVVADIIPAEIKRHPEESVRQEDLPDVDEAFNVLPTASHPMIQKYASFYKEWLAHSDGGEYWEGASPCFGYENITAPALNISGWYDIFLWSTLENYQGMRTRGGAEVSRKPRMVIGPWTHINFSGTFPEREFGSEAGSEAIDLPGIHIDWFNRFLKDQKDPDQQKTDLPVMIYVMGEDKWRYEADWPLPDTQYRPFYLHSNGKANTLEGDGSLSAEVPGSEPSDSFIFDPFDPVPTTGGQVLLPGENSTGPRDQRSVEKREDVLVYSTPVLKEAVEVTGPVVLKLFVSSSVQDTDFTGKLVDVFPDGRAMILTEGILRTRYRKREKGPQLMEPGEVYELTLNLWATSNLFLPGHSIRLEVSGSNFPRFDRNSNTGGDISSESPEKYRSAKNIIFHDSERPSQLILPVIERSNR